MLECMRDANEAKGFGLLRNNQSIGIDDYHDVTLSPTCVAIGPAPVCHDPLPPSSSRTGRQHAHVCSDHRAHCHGLIASLVETAGLEGGGCGHGGHATALAAGATGGKAKNFGFGDFQFEDQEGP